MEFEGLILDVSLYNDKNINKCFIFVSDNQDGLFICEKNNIY